jgi:S1-C subfamily serine protease
MKETNPLLSFSEALSEAVAKAGVSTLLVDTRQRMPASGIAYAPDLVLTADHVVEREDDLRVMLHDGSVAPAVLAGRDSGSDLALLRVSGASLVMAERAASEPRIGQLVLALGRPNPDGVQASLGVISAYGGPVRTGRGGMLEKFLRTDATPYPGFSGGPLIDVAGRVIGLNTSGLARSMSLAIPIAQAWSVAEILARHGHVRRGYLGIRSQPVPLPAAQQTALGRVQESGLLLVGIDDGGPAGKAGLMIGDILVGLNDHPVSDPDELLARLAGPVVGQAVPVQVLRGGHPVTLPVVIGGRD